MFLIFKTQNAITLALNIDHIRAVNLDTKIIESESQLFTVSDEDWPRIKSAIYNQSLMTPKADYPHNANRISDEAIAERLSKP